MELGPHKNRGKLWPGWELNPRPSGLITAAPTTELLYNVRQEQVVGNEDVNCTAMNMFKYKEGLCLLQTLQYKFHLWFIIIHQLKQFFSYQRWISHIFLQTRLFALNGLNWFHKKLSIISSTDVKRLLHM